MGNLTDDMTRLRGEVEALRGVRGALMQDLTRGARDLTTAVAAMRADFTSAHAAMAKQTRGERETFMAAVIDDVNSLLGEFSRDRNDMAREGRHDRRTFLSEMSRQVAGMCKETADDLMGARLAWQGRGIKKSRKSREVPPPQEPEVVEHVPPPVEEARLEQEQEATPMTAMKETPLEVMEAKEAPVEVTEVTAAPETPAVKPPKVKAPEPVVDSVAFQKSKEKSWLDEKPSKTKTVTKGKRGRT